jgi:hypothetical protein
VVRHRNAFLEQLKIKNKMEDLKKEMHCPIRVEDLKEGDEFLKGHQSGLMAAVVLRTPKLSKVRKSWIDRNRYLYVNTLCKVAMLSKTRTYTNYQGVKVKLPYVVYIPNFAEINTEKRLDLNEQELWLVRRKIEHL